MMKLVLPLSLLLLAGCGSAGSLRPPEGQAMPVKPAMAQVTPTAADLLTKPAFAAPERIDELLRRSVPRKADRFDLPPPDGGAVPPADDQAPVSDAVRVQEPE